MKATENEALHLKIQQKFDEWTKAQCDELAARSAFWHFYALGKVRRLALPDFGEIGSRPSLNPEAFDPQARKELLALLDKAERQVKAIAKKRAAKK